MKRRSSSGRRSISSGRSSRGTPIIKTLDGGQTTSPEKKREAAARKIQALSRRRYKKKISDISDIFCGRSDAIINRKNQKILDDILFVNRDMSLVKRSGNNNNNNITIGNFTLKQIKKLGEGSYSKVLEYYDELNGVKVAFKIENAEFPAEKEISEMIQHCGAIKEVYFKSDVEYQNHFYFMSLAHGGTLDDLKKRINNWDEGRRKKLIKLIVEKIRKQVVCLYKKGYIYTDFKLPNILVDCDGSSGLQIYLGDLGSAIPDKYNNEYVATYPPPDVTQNHPGLFHLKTEEEKQGVISWGLGILLYFLMPSSTNNFNHFNYSKDKYNVQKHPESIREMNDYYGGGNFGNYLSEEAKNRPSIFDEIII